MLQFFNKFFKIDSFRKLQPNRLMKVNDLKKVLTQYGSMAMTEDEVMIKVIYKTMIFYLKSKMLLQILECFLYNKCSVKSYILLLLRCFQDCASLIRNFVQITVCCKNLVSFKGWGFDQTSESVIHSQVSKPSISQSYF